MNISSISFATIFKTIITIIILFFIVNIITSTFSTIPAGHRGVVFSKVSGIENSIRNEGWTFLTPFVQTLYEIPVMTRKISFEGGEGNLAPLEAASIDMQTITISVIATYHIPEENVVNVFRAYNMQWDSKLLMPQIQEVVKVYTAKYKAIEILQNREKLKMEIKDMLSKTLMDKGIVLEDMVIANIQFSKEFEDAIEKTQISEQQAIQQRYELERAEIKAQEQVKIAEAQKTSKILEGEAIAEYNRLIQQKVDDNVLRYKELENAKIAIEKWNGSYPQTMMGDAIPLIQISK